MKLCIIVIYYRAEAKEDEKEVAAGFGRIKGIARFLSEDRFRQELLELTTYTVFKHPRVFQYALYLLEYNREEICEKATNKLWLHKLPLLIDEKFFERLMDYTPLGPKPGTYPKYRNINAIEKNLEEVKDEDIAAYSLAYSELLRWLRECVKIRKADILVRKNKRQAAKEEREAKIKEKEEWVQKRAEALKELVAAGEAAWEEEKKKEFDEAQGDKDEFDNLEGIPVTYEIPKYEYDEEVLLEEWNEKNPQIEIPDEVVEEIDNDYEQPAA